MSGSLSSYNKSIPIFFNFLFAHCINRRTHVKISEMCFQKVMKEEPRRPVAVASPKVTILINITIIPHFEDASDISVSKNEVSLH